MAHQPLTYLGEEGPQTVSPKSIIMLGFISLCYKHEGILFPCLLVIKLSISVYLNI